MIQAPTRRDKLRQTTTRDIKVIARRHMLEQGTASLSMRAIATEMGMAVSALYRYFASRDDLLTILVHDSFTALGDETEQNYMARRSDGFTQRLLGTANAYRDWALGHPIDFQLIFGNPIPGFHCPPEITGPAVWRVFTPFLNIIQEAIDAGFLTPKPAYTQDDSALSHHIAANAAREGLVSPIPLQMAIGMWGTMYGLVMLELYGHLQPIVGDQTSTLYQRTIIGCLQQAGWPE